MRFHGAMLNRLSTKTTLPFLILEHKSSWEETVVISEVINAYSDHCNI